MTNTKKGISIHVAPVEVSLKFGGNERGHFCDQVITVRSNRTDQTSFARRADFAEKLEALANSIALGEDPMATEFVAYVCISRTPVKPSFMRTDDLGTIPNPTKKPKVESLTMLDKVLALRQKDKDLSPKEIAVSIGRRPNYVYSALSTLRKQGRIPALAKKAGRLKGRA